MYFISVDFCVQQKLIWIAKDHYLTFTESRVYGMEKPSGEEYKAILSSMY